MALIKSYKGLAPKWGRDCYFSENATIVGDVTMGDECSVWFNAVVRGDVAPITIGNCTNIQDGSCVHVTFDTGPTHIGNYVTIGHNVTVHACTIHDHALIGMGSTLLDGCEVGEGSIVAAGALVLVYRPSTSSPYAQGRLTMPSTTLLIRRFICKKRRSKE